MLNEALFLQSVSLGSDGETMDHVRAVRKAQGLYMHFVVNGWLCRIGSALTGQPRCLTSLSKRDGGSTANASHGGLRVVTLSQVRGSESRAGDFDRGFHPLRFEDRDRWLALATAWLMGIALPPVELIQVGDNYFVRDGHHRISVARALGQSFIDAQVTVRS